MQYQKKTGKKIGNFFKIFRRVRSLECQPFYSKEIISINISSMEQWHHQTKKLCEEELSGGILSGAATFC